MVLTLYKIDASPPVRAVKMTIEYLGLQDIEYVDVNLSAGEHHSEEYLKLNPQHSVPVLKDDDFVIWDSHAIAIYLITKYSDDDSLYPADPQKRAVVNQRLHFDSGVLFPALGSTIKPILFLGEKVPRLEGVEKIKEGYELIEKFLTSDWLTGDEVTLADICCVSTISNMNELVPIDGDLYPNLVAWFERCSEQDFFKKGNLPGLLKFRAYLKSVMA